MVQNNLFFQPYKGCHFDNGFKYNESAKPVKLMVLGASFYCDLSNCKYYNKCTVNSKEFDDKCPAEGYLGSNENDKRGMYLHDSPAIEIESYLEGAYYPTYDRFVKVILNLSQTPQTSEKEKVWKYVMFNNYIQHFIKTVTTPQYNKNQELFDNDFNGILSMIKSNAIECVVVWGKPVRDAIKANFEKLNIAIRDLDVKNFNHVIKIDDQEIVFCYFDHPSCRTFMTKQSKEEHHKHFIKALKKAGESSQNKNKITQP